MKKTMKMISLILFLFSLNSIVLGQEHLKLERIYSISYDNESEPTEFEIDFTEEYNFLSVEIESDINQGELVLEFIDPKNNVIRSFTIITVPSKTKGEKTSYKENARAKLEKGIREPMVGKWLVRITPKNAIGKTKVYSIFVKNPRVNLLEIDQIIEDTDLHLK